LLDGADLADQVAALQVVLDITISDVEITRAGTLS